MVALGEKLHLSASIWRDPSRRPGRVTESGYTAAAKFIVCALLLLVMVLCDVLWHLSVASRLASEIDEDAAADSRGSVHSARLRDGDSAGRGLN